MFRLMACAALRRIRLRLKTAAPFSKCDGFELPVTRAKALGGRFILSKNREGESHAFIHCHRRLPGGAL